MDQGVKRGRHSRLVDGMNDNRSDIIDIVGAGLTAVAIILIAIFI